MNESVVVMGCDGYIGHALTLRLLEKGYRVYGIDDFQRRENVEEMGSFSATDIDHPLDRHEKIKQIYPGQFEFYELSIDFDYKLMCDFLKDANPHTIVNLAQQPSAPYSFVTRSHAVKTSHNNLIGTLNCLYFMKEFCPDAHLIQIGSMGEYDPAAGTDIPEGTFDLEFNGKTGENMIFPRRPGSFYHASKVASTFYIDAACRWWGLTATDIMQGVVYGNYTPEIQQSGVILGQENKIHTRLDSDECFGTVVNRFVIQSILGEPLTVYGEGHQRRGYLALNDSVQCLMLAIENAPAKGEYRTWNQLDQVWTINELARLVQDLSERPVAIEHIPTPRVERTDKFVYKPYTDKLRQLGFEPTRGIEEEILYMIAILEPIADELFPLANVIKPNITWK